MRRESSFLKDIITAAGKIESITAATSEQTFLSDDVLPAAVLHHLTVIGEAIQRLPPDLTRKGVSGIAAAPRAQLLPANRGQKACVRTAVFLEDLEAPVIVQ